MAATAGPTEREFDHLARKFAALTRTVVAVSCCLLGLLVVPARWQFADLAAAGVVIGWSLVYAVRLPVAPARWITAADVLLICLLCLSQGALVPQSAIADGTSWVMAVLSMSAATYQWHTSAPAGALGTLLVVGAYLTGTAIWYPSWEAGWLPATLWVLAEAGLSRGVWLLLRHGGRRADAYLAANEKARIAVAVAQARQADEREQLARLHDTAAATLLVIGAGALSQQHSWVAGQARRDLAVLQAGLTPPGPGLVELDRLLLTVTSQSGITVQHDLEPAVVPAPVAAAISGGVGEALRNVARHAGTDEASLRLTAGDRVLVEVRDAGTGFDPGRVPASRRGISESVIARMQRAGGLGAVVSAPGQGTVVRLEWAGG